MAEDDSEELDRAETPCLTFDAIPFLTQQKICAGPRSPAQCALQIMEARGLSMREYSGAGARPAIRDVRTEFN